MVVRTSEGIERLPLRSTINVPFSGSLEMTALTCAHVLIFDADYSVSYGYGDFTAASGEISGELNSESGQVGCYSEAAAYHALHENGAAARMPVAQGFAVHIELGVFAVGVGHNECGHCAVVMGDNNCFFNFLPSLISKNRII